MSVALREESFPGLTSDLCHYKRDASAGDSWGGGVKEAIVGGDHLLSL